MGRRKRRGLLISSWKIVQAAVLGAQTNLRVF